MCIDVGIVCCVCSVYTVIVCQAISLWQITSLKVMFLEMYVNVWFCLFLFLPLLVVVVVVDDDDMFVQRSEINSGQRMLLYENNNYYIVVIIIIIILLYTAVEI